MKVKKNRLSDMDYDEVSLVDVGAGEGANVVLFKRDTQAGEDFLDDESVSSDEEPVRKESRLMATEVLEKRAGKRECAECGTEVSKGDTECPDCGSDSIMKSIIIVRKEVTDESVSDEELDDALEAVEDEDGEEEDDQEDDTDDEEESDEVVESDESDEPVEKKFTSAESAAVSVGALAVATEYAVKIAKAFEGGVSTKTPVQYESIMTEFNAAMDEAAQGWLAKSLETSSEISKKAGEVQSQITTIIKHATEGGAMPQINRPATLDGLDLPTDVAEYVSGLEAAAGIEKKDIYAGLDPEVAQIVRKSAEIVEESEQQKWLGIAKSFDAVPGDKAELAKSLRTLHSTDKTAYDALVKSLEGANEAAKRGDITKSWGAPGGGEPSDVIEKRRTTAKSLVESGQFPTIEQAEVHLLSANPSEYGQN